MLVEKNLIKQDLISKLENHSAIIGIIGLGYVGLPLSKAYISQKLNISQGVHPILSMWI